jgi:Restriction endonuclease
VECARTPHRRGLLFEAFLAQMLEEESFAVSSNPKIAKPRQTDLYAERDDLSFLIEAKWWSTPIHTGHISAVRERLRSCPRNLFACVFSMSGYTDNGVQEALRERSLEIVLFDEAEIRGVAAGDFSTAELLIEKRKRLRDTARMWFEKREADERLHVRRQQSPPLLELANGTKQWILSTKKDYEVIFAKELLDLGAYNDAATSLRIPLDLNSCDDLGRFLRKLKKQIGLANDESFAIHQGSAGWYGFGAENFITAVESWKKRYHELRWDSYHHSEELAFFDRLQSGGMVCLTSRQRVGKDVYLHSTFLEVMTSGVPVDMSGLRRLCTSTQNLDARLETLLDKRVDKYRFHPRIPVDAVGRIVTSEQGMDYVSGLIVKNPFFDRTLPIQKFPSPNSPLQFLTNNEFLVCAMPQWHGANTPTPQYDLIAVEACWVENIPVLYVRCDWR